MKGIFTNVATGLLLVFVLLIGKYKISLKLITAVIVPGIFSLLLAYRIIQIEVLTKKEKIRLTLISTGIFYFISLISYFIGIPQIPYLPDPFNNLYIYLFPITFVFFLVRKDKKKMLSLFFLCSSIMFLIILFNILERLR